MTDRLPKALEILKKQNKILFGKNFKEVNHIRKVQFENFIQSIIKDIKFPELNAQTLTIKGKKIEEKKTNLVWRNQDYLIYKIHFLAGIN